MGEDPAGRGLGLPTSCGAPLRQSQLGGRQPTGAPAGYLQLWAGWRRGQWGELDAGHVWHRRVNHTELGKTVWGEWPRAGLDDVEPQGAGPVGAGRLGRPSTCTSAASSQAGPERGHCAALLPCMHPFFSTCVSSPCQKVVILPDIKFNKKH